MEPVGFTVGVAGLFAVSLDVLDRISAAKTYGKDYQTLVTKVEIERLRLLLWGQAVGLSPAADGISASPQQLQDPRIQGAVCELLSWAIQLFKDSETFKKRHTTTGITTRELSTFLPSRSSSGRQISVVTTTAIDSPRGRAGLHQKKASAMMKMRWALSGKRKSEKLLEDLSWFVDKLHELVPPRVSIQLPTPPPTTLRLTSLSVDMQGRIVRRRSEFRIRQTRKHARRIAVGMDKKLRQIQVDER